MRLTNGLVAVDKRSISTRPLSSCIGGLDSVAGAAAALVAAQRLDAFASQRPRIVVPPSTIEAVTKAIKLAAQVQLPDFELVEAWEQSARTCDRLAHSPRTKGIGLAVARLWRTRPCRQLPPAEAIAAVLTAPQEVATLNAWADRMADLGEHEISAMLRASARALCAAFYTVLIFCLDTPGISDTSDVSSEPSTEPASTRTPQGVCRVRAVLMAAPPSRNRLALAA